MTDTEINWADITKRFFKWLRVNSLDRYRHPKPWLALVITVVASLLVVYLIFWLCCKYPNAGTYYGRKKIREREEVEAKAALVIGREIRGKRKIKEAKVVKTSIAEEFKAIGRKEVYREAVEKGHGEWVVIDTDGNTEFRWIDFSK